uniref:Uncharacterized protein n=1 Tax=Spermophilus dauricus TaxID=99837 RepID=A0A8C9NXG0_SPEDA
VMGHHNHNHITHLEVLRIHMQLVTVQLTETCKGALEVVEVFQAITKGINHLLAMRLHFSIAHNSRCRGQVPKGIKEHLGPWVDNQQPEGGLSTNFCCIHLAPGSTNGILLPITQMHHCVFLGGVASKHKCVRSKCKQQLALLCPLCPALTPRELILSALIL